MADFNRFKPKVIISPKLILTIEIELNNSSYTAEEAAERLQYLLNSYNMKEFSNLIVALIRETKSSTWELKKLELNNANRR